MATGTTALTEANSFDDRNIEPLVKPVWHMEIVFTFASGQADATTHTLNLNGLLRKLVVKCSGASGAVVTATVAINDSADNERFSQSGLAENSTTPFDLDEALSGAIDLVVTPNTDPLSAYTVTLYLEGI